MFEFHWPWMATLILLPLLVRLLWPRFVQSGQEEPIEGRRTTLLYSSLQRLQTSFNGHTPGAAIAGKLQALTLMLLWAALTLAAMAGTAHRNQTGRLRSDAGGGYLTLHDRAGLHP